MQIDLLSKQESSLGNSWVNNASPRTPMPVAAAYRKCWISRGCSGAVTVSARDSLKGLCGHCHFQQSRKPKSGQGTVVKHEDSSLSPGCVTYYRCVFGKWLNLAELQCSTIQNEKNNGFFARLLLRWASQVVLVVKNPPVNAGDVRDAGSIPGLGRFPGGGQGN